MKEEYDEEEHADDDDDETTTHAIVIADENEHETENETAERTRARRNHRRRARRSRQDEEEEDDDEVQDVEAQRSRIPATGKSDPTHIDAGCTYGREAGYQEEEEGEEGEEGEEEGEEEGDQETLPPAHDQNLPLRQPTMPGVAVMKAVNYGIIASRITDLQNKRCQSGSCHRTHLWEQHKHLMEHLL